MLSSILNAGHKYQYGLVLSGGGARGFAHLGAIQALKENGIKPDIISGVSAGAIVGAFIASGRKPKEVLELLKGRGLYRFSKFRVPSKGLLNLIGLQQLLEKEIPIKQLEDLEIPLIISASNLNQGKVEYFESGNLTQLVVASSSIPVLFAPVKIGDHFFVDGGLYDNLPINPIEHLCHKIIGVNISTIDETDELKNIIQIATRTFHLSVNANTRYHHDKFDLLIEPKELAKFDILSNNKAEELFEIGYNKTIEQLNLHPL